MKRIVLAFGLAAMAANLSSGVSAATETVLFSFRTAATQGAYPSGPVIMDSHGALYGTTSSGGA